MAADWQVVGEVRHTFTHFHLILEVRRADLPLADSDAFREPGKAAAAMPTVFAKACRLAGSDLS